MPKSLSITDRWNNLHRQYALWRMGVTFKESRSYNTTDRILLTFDDFGTPQNIKGILDVLDEHKVKAAFFIKGKWAKENPELAKLFKERGHWLESHSYNHVRLDLLSNDEIRDELVNGLKTKLMRPPYGAYNSRVRKIASSLGFKIAYWTIDSLDWKDISAARIQENVLPRLHPGACVLLHLNTAYTLEALPGLIAGIRAQGFELCHDGTEIKA